MFHGSSSRCRCHRSYRHLEPIDVAGDGAEQANRPTPPRPCKVQLPSTVVTMPDLLKQSWCHSFLSSSVQASVLALLTMNLLRHVVKHSLQTMSDHLIIIRSRSTLARSL